MKDSYKFHCVDLINRMAAKAVMTTSSLAPFDEPKGDHIYFDYGCGVEVEIDGEQGCFSDDEWHEAFTAQLKARDQSA